MSADDHVDDLEWEEWDPSKTTFATHMVAGSFAGLAEHVSIFPLDTLKTQAQCERCGSISPLQTWNCATRMVHNEGIFRLWRGVSAMFAGCIPAHAAYFSVFETMKRFTGADQTGHHPVAAAASGATASLSHDICMTPFDTVKQRMQLGYYRNISHCARSLFLHEGIRAFYVSLPATLAMNLPFGMIMAATNESARKYLSRLNPDGQLTMANSMLAGCFAGGVAAAGTNPLDVIKTRLQTQNLEPCPTSATTSTISTTGSVPVTKIVQNSSTGPKTLSASTMPVRNISSSTLGAEPIYSANFVRQGAWSIMRQIWREEGAMGFMRGIAPRMMVQAPGVAISWTAYETAKRFITEF
jgi:solute carrier family 25 iron transporter 28/37